ncbi:MAG: hypothetical protein ACI9LN_002131 [Saprospiraceae bacterium]|jgi:hypothetical protein
MFPTSCIRHTLSNFYGFQKSRQRISRLFPNLLLLLNIKFGKLFFIIFNFLATYPCCLLYLKFSISSDFTLFLLTKSIVAISCGCYIFYEVAVF